MFFKQECVNNVECGKKLRMLLNSNTACDAVTLSLYFLNHRAFWGDGTWPSLVQSQV